MHSNNIRVLKTASGLTFAYEWLRDGDLIAGATAATYRLAGTADADREITCRVTARSATGGSVRRLAANGATLPPLPVVNPDSPPTVQGVPDAGQTVTCDAGQWTGARSFASSHRGKQRRPAASGFPACTRSAPMS